MTKTLIPEAPPRLVLRDLAREVVDSSESVEFDALATELLERLSPDDYRDALAQALPMYVRMVAHGMHKSGPVAQPPSGNESWKVVAIREDWQRRLAEIYSTAEGNKRLGDFTYRDLLYQSDLLQRQAKHSLARAKGWEGLAKAVRTSGVTCVRDLDPKTLQAKLEPVA